MNQLLHFLRFMPLRYFAGGGLWSGPAPTLAFYLAPQDARLLLTRKKKPVGYEPSLVGEPDSPPLPEGSGISRAVQARQLLSPKFARRYGLNTDVEHLFVVDCSLKDLYLQVATLSALRRKTPASLLEDLHEDPARILEEWDDHRPYRWTVLANSFRLEPLSKAGIDEQVILVGLPEEYCEQLETWSEAEGATISAIVPLVVAVYAYIGQVILPADVTRPGIGIVATDCLALVAVSRAGNRVEVIHLHKNLPEALRSIPTTVADLRIAEHFLYVWASGDQLAQVDLPPEAIALDGERLRANSGSLVVAESHGKKVSHDEPVTHLLAWLAGQ